MYGNINGEPCSATFLSKNHRRSIRRRQKFCMQASQADIYMLSSNITFAAKIKPDQKKPLHGFEASGDYVLVASADCFCRIYLPTGASGNVVEYPILGISASASLELLAQHKLDETNRAASAHIA
jgi:hypothetical protein